LSVDTLYKGDDSPLQPIDGSWLSARGLFCERDERVLFSNLNFDLFSGDIVRIAGPNGAGKSSLMRILLGLSAGFDGALFWHGQDMKKMLYDFRSQLLYLGHQVGVKGGLTPEENLKWFNPCASQAQIFAALKKVGLTGFEDLLTHGLSAGQQRRVALARLFLCDKPLWILDEPFTAIDKEGVAELEQVVIDHAKNGGLVILTTHHELNVPVKTLMLGAQKSELPLC
jgi:heme exporter protein A